MAKDFAKRAGTARNYDGDRYHNPIGSAPKAPLALGKVKFVRIEGYMEKAKTHTEMEFYTPDGRRVEGVIHAWAVLESALDDFVENVPFPEEQIKVFEEAPVGYNKIYSLDWSEVNAFVAVDKPRGGSLIYAMAMARSSETPPQPRRFKRRHAVRLEVVPEICGSCGEQVGWEVKAQINYQVVFSREPIGHIKGAPVNSFGGDD